MPRTYTAKLPPDKQPLAKLVRLIRGYCPSEKDIAAALMLSDKTARSRMMNPELFTLAELRRLSCRLHIPMQEIRESLIW